MTATLPPGDRLDHRPRRRRRERRHRVPPRRRPRLPAPQPGRGVPRREPHLDERRVRRFRDPVRAELLADGRLDGRRHRRRHPGRPAHRDHRAAHRNQHDGFQRRVLRHPRPVHRVGHRAGHRVRIRRGDGVDERRRDRRRRAPAAGHAGERRGARDRLRRCGGADGDGCAVRPRDDRRDAEGGCARRRGADDPWRVRVRGRVPARCVKRRIHAGWLLADVGAVGRAVRGRADLLRADNRRLHPTNLGPAVQQSADLRCVGHRHVRRRAAAQPVRRIHRCVADSPIRPTPTSTTWCRPPPVGTCCRSWSSRCWAG